MFAILVEGKLDANLRSGLACGDHSWFRTRRSMTDAWTRLDARLGVPCTHAEVRLLRSTTFQFYVRTESIKPLTVRFEFFHELGLIRRNEDSGSTLIFQAPVKSLRNGYRTMHVQLSVTQLDVASSTPGLESKAVELGAAIKDDVQRLTSVLLEQLVESLGYFSSRRHFLERDHTDTESGMVIDHSQHMPTIRMPLRNRERRPGDVEAVAYGNLRQVCPSGKRAARELFWREWRLGCAVRECDGG
jgi:hypothetical protein